VIDSGNTRHISGSLTLLVSGLDLTGGFTVRLLFRPRRFLITDHTDFKAIDWTELLVKSHEKLTNQTESDV
jgi:hypothetical protein